jgi:DNA repair protein RecN (Recombination protein N)
MLKSLYILNYALISELKIDFQTGFSVITGETGAGKSIIIGALSLILGQRAETKAIKTDAEKCVIEAEFDISNYAHLQNFFLTNDLDFSNSHCLIRREIVNSGKSRAFINDTPVSLNLLRELTIQLIDIHSQHDNLLLSNDNYQLEVVDAIAENAELLGNYQQKYGAWQQLLTDLKLKEQSAARLAAELDYIQFQHNQLSDSKLIVDEQEQLEQEQESLLHSEEIKTELSNSTLLLDADQAILPSLKESIASIAKIKKYIAEGNTWFERLESSYIDLKDISSEIYSFIDKVEYDPQRLELIQNRLSDIYTLQKKYKVETVAELINIRDDFELQLSKIESFDDDIIELKKQIESSFRLVQQMANDLHESRKQALDPIEKHMVEQLTKLGMPNIQFKVQLSQIENYLPLGLDEVQFYFSANKNRPIQPVQLIASGGEISRLMLSLKYLIANRSGLPTIIFDEIDTGVSGEIAHRMGEIMGLMSASMQVITITHLPQIAAKSNHHYRVYKDDSGIQTQTHIVKMTEEERIKELAQMLSGKNLTEASVQNARDLLGTN